MAKVYPDRSTTVKSSAANAAEAPHSGRRLAIAHFLLGRCNPNSANGIDQCVYHVSRNQAAQGHEVSLYSLTRKDPLPIPGVRVRTYAPAFELPSVLPGSLTDILVDRSPAAVPRKLVADLLDDAPDIVHMHHTQVPANVVVGNRAGAAGIPYCVTLHGALVGEARNRRRFLKTVYRIVWERNHLDRAAFLHAISRADADGARALGFRAPIEVVPNGIDVGPRPHLEPDDLGLRFPELRGRRIITFVGRLDPEQKGLDLLCEALGRSGANLGLLLVGPTFRGGRGKLESLVRRLQLADRVAFAGPVFGHEKRRILAGSAAFVHTSRWEAGVPFSVLEAAAAGIPCLVSEAADPDAVLEEGGGGVRVELDVESIADGLRALDGATEAELKSMGAHGREVVRREFSWERIARKLTSLYEAHGCPR